MVTGRCPLKAGSSFRSVPASASGLASLRPPRVPLTVTFNLFPLPLPVLVSSVKRLAYMASRLLLAKPPGFSENSEQTGVRVTPHELGGQRGG